MATTTMIMMMVTIIPTVDMMYEALPSWCARSGSYAAELLALTVQNSDQLYYIIIIFIVYYINYTIIITLIMKDISESDL